LTVDSDARIDPRLAVAPQAKSAQREVIYRHTAVVRVSHWVNVLVIALLLMSGLQIFNAHPQLHWGLAGDEYDPSWLRASATVGASGLRGHLMIGGLDLHTTGFLGASPLRLGGPLHVRGFPAWATLPSWQDLATGRRWHFFLAWIFVINGLAYLAWGLFSGHLRRDLAPSRGEIAPASLVASIVDHIRLRHPTGEAAKRYNVLQKLAYVGVVFIILPGVIATGLAMSPGIDAAAPWLPALLGGRQSARSIHFICANLIVLFVLVHVVEVFLAGPVNEIASMITGRYVVPRARRR
jgi:thiosulfate reductase cytochrome b subunit